MFLNIPVTVIAQAKGKSTEENIKRNFGMSNQKDILSSNENCKTG